MTCRASPSQHISMPPCGCRMLLCRCGSIGQRHTAIYTTYVAGRRQVKSPDWQTKSQSVNQSAHAYLPVSLAAGTVLAVTCWSDRASKRLLTRLAAAGSCSLRAALEAGCRSQRPASCCSTSTTVSVLLHLVCLQQSSRPIFAATAQCLSVNMLTDCAQAVRCG